MVKVGNVKNLHWLNVIARYNLWIHIQGKNNILIYKELAWFIWILFCRIRIFKLTH